MSPVGNILLMLMFQTVNVLNEQIKNENEVFATKTTLSDYL